jgi:hypothetical protein
MSGKEENGGGEREEVGREKIRTQIRFRKFFEKV